MRGMDGVRERGFWRRRGGSAFLALLLVSVAGCAGSTLGSGVGERWLEEAPYYAGSGSSGLSAVAWTPVTFQVQAADAQAMGPESGEGSAVARLLDEMNRHLAALAEGSASAGPVGAHVPLVQVDAPAGRAPDVEFGCEFDTMDECVEPGEAMAGPQDGTPRMRLAVARPSGEWTLGAAEAMADAGAEGLLVLTLEVGYYWPRQTNWRGSKAVDLGTGRTESLPWLTSLDDPVAVLQLTGALVGPDGRATRIGAEGLLVRRTPLLASGFGFRALISDAEVEEALTARVGDEADGPLVWQVALETLVQELVEG